VTCEINRSACGRAQTFGGTLKTLCKHQRQPGNRPEVSRVAQSKLAGFSINSTPTKSSFGKNTCSGTKTKKGAKQGTLKRDFYFWHKKAGVTRP